jgi:prepilin-type processing-associated H-X9-DG protein
MVSYNTSRNFMWLGLDAQVERPPGSPHWSLHRPGTGFARVSPSYADQPPTDYVPFLEQVGRASDKVFIADGSRYNAILLPPDYDIDPLTSWGGAFADSGPYYDYTRAWHRWAAPGAKSRVIQQIFISLGAQDNRLYAYRHGNRVPYQPDFRMNVGFFDGHVELLNSRDSAKPHLWLPTGGTLRRDASLYDDVRAIYFGDQPIIDIE